MAKMRRTFALVAAGALWAVLAAGEARGARRYRLENVLRIGEMRLYKATITESQVNEADGHKTKVVLERGGVITHLPLKAGAGGEVICGVLENWRAPKVIKYEVDGSPLPAGSSMSLPPPLAQLIAEVQTRRGKPLEVMAMPKAHFTLGLIPRDAQVWPRKAVAIDETWRRYVAWGRVRGKYNYVLAGLDNVNGIECVKTVVAFEGKVSGANPEDFFVDSAKVTLWTHPTRYYLVRRTSDIRGRYSRDGGKTKVSYSRQMDWQLTETRQLGAAATAAAHGVIESVRKRADNEDKLVAYMAKVLDAQPGSPWQSYAEYVVNPPKGAAKSAMGPPRPKDHPSPTDPRLKVTGKVLVAVVAKLIDSWTVAASANRAADTVGYARSLARIAKINRDELIRFIGSADKQQRVTAAMALAVAKKDVPEGFAGLATDESKAVRKHVALAVGIREPARPMADLLAVLIDDKSSAVRRTALWAAWRTTKRGDAGALKLSPLVMAKLSDHRYSVRAQAARCLGIFAPKAAAKKALLARRKTEADVEVAKAIADALKKLAK